MAKSIPNLFGTKTESVLCLKVPSHTTIWFSNVVGPQEEIAFFGYPIAYIAPSCSGQPNTINDVVMGVSLAGLSQYLNRRYGEAKGEAVATQKKNNLPENIRLRATLLVNIRPSPGIHALDDMMKGTKAKWCNCIGSVLLPFTIALRDDPLEYVRQAKATIDRKKHSQEVAYTFLIVKFVLKLFGIKAAAFLFHRVPNHTTLCFSNIIGPIEEIGFYGHPLAFIAPSCYGQPHGLMVHFQSYTNKMTFILSVDEAIIADPHQLCDDIEESLKLMKDVVTARGIVKENLIK